LQLEDGDNYEAWEKLVRAVESVDGGINRNSSPQAITAMRDIYDRFLAKFPLFFGYWKKYADLEFSIAGTEAAEMVRSCPRAKEQTTVDQGARSMNEALQASQTLSISGRIIAPSRPIQAMTPTSFESK
jgi:hypothetical protein